MWPTLFQGFIEEISHELSGVMRDAVQAVGKGWLFTAKTAVYKKFFMEVQKALPSRGPAGISE